MTLPHCTGCTEPGEPTHQQETVEHIHDVCEKRFINTVAWPQYRELNALIAELRAWNAELQEAHCSAACPDRHHVGDRPIPPAAAKLLAERDAGRALYEEVVGCGVVAGPEVWQAVEAYRKVVD